MIYPLRRGVQSLRELFILLGGVYSRSVNYLATWEGCTVPPPIIYPLWRGVQSLRELFSHLGGVYGPSVNYLSTLEGCTVPP